MRYSLWCNALTMLLATGRWPATSWVIYTTSCNTQSSVTEDGRNYRPKHVELIGIINKSLLLHLVGCLYYCVINTFKIRDFITIQTICTRILYIFYLRNIYTYIHIRFSTW